MNERSTTIKRGTETRARLRVVTYGRAVDHAEVAMTVVNGDAISMSHADASEAQLREYAAHLLAAADELKAARGTQEVEDLAAVTRLHQVYRDGGVIVDEDPAA